MQPTIAVGLESTLDILINFSKLEDFGDFVRDYEGGLSSDLSRAHEKLSSGSDGEVPIDGREKEAQKLLELAKNAGAETNYVLGGNGSQEAVTLSKLGAETIFLGATFPNSFSKLSASYQKILDESDTSFARKFREYSPASYILQATETNRYILTEGRGRRIKQLRPYLRNLPDIVNEVVEAYGKLDALSLVGWQVVFGNNLSEDDYHLVVQTIEEIREETEALLFTDAGDVGTLNNKEKERLCGIYSLFDILSVNGDELRQISEVLDSGREDEIQMMKGCLEKSENLTSLWLHKPGFQITLSEKFSQDTLEKAQDFSSLAGLYKVEKGGYPDVGAVSKLRKTHELSEEGLSESQNIRAQYGSSLDNKTLAVTPCYEAEKFTSTVGAGDVSAAAYLYSIAKVD